MIESGPFRAFRIQHDAAGYRADGLARLLQFFLVQIKVKTGAAVPWPAVGLDAGRRELPRCASAQDKAGGEQRQMNKAEG